MISYKGNVYGISNIQFKRTSKKNHRPKYVIFSNQRAYPISGVAAKVFEDVIHFDTHHLTDTSRDRKMTNCLRKFLNLDWIRDSSKENGLFRLTDYTYCTTDDEKYYVMNFLYRTIDRIDKNIYEMLTGNEIEHLPSDDLFYLYSRRYIENDRGFCPNEQFVNQSNNKIVYLIFSYNCNLKCTYCFERGKTRSLGMRRETLEKAVEYIDSLSIGNLVTVTLYGGEPFLASNSESINYVIDKLKDNKNIGFAFITNGVNVIDFSGTLARIKDRIMHFVITLDGTRDIHDSRRLVQENQGSFDSIMNSILFLNKNDYPIKIRINVDRDNISCQKELVHYLNRAIRKKKKVKIEYHRVEDKANKNFSPLSYLECYRLYRKVKKESKFDTSFYLPIINMLDLLEKEDEGFPRIRDYFCTIDANYVIDYDGSIYSCNEAMGIEDFKVGHIGLTDQKEDRKIPIMNDCKYCSFFLGCYGGCYLENYYHLRSGEEACHYEQIIDVIHYFLQEAFGTK